MKKICDDVTGFEAQHMEVRVNMYFVNRTGFNLDFYKKGEASQRIRKTI